MEEFGIEIVASRLRAFHEEWAGLPGSEPCCQCWAVLVLEEAMACLTRGTASLKHLVVDDLLKRGFSAGF